MQGTHLQSDTNSARGALPPALVVSLPFDGSQTQDRLGKEAYSYFFVYHAFAPFLKRWAASVVEVTRPESRLDYAIWRCRQAGLAPFHLSFLPLQQTYLSAQAPNIAFPFWEFPDIPSADVVRDPRNDWRRLTDKLSLVLTASTFTRDALLRAGVRQPIRVIPVPVHPAYFSIPDWQPDQRVRMDCPYYTIPQEDTPAAGADPAQGVAARTGGPMQWARLAYRWTVHPFLPAWARRTIGRAVRSAMSAGEKPQTPANPALELSGVVYTTILNLDDSRKNWTDLVSSVLFALRECDDATLVVKIVAEGERLAQNLGWIEGYRNELALRHRCRLVVIPGYLSEEQMRELARASTYYINTSHAEGACLPLQSFLAAGRPGIAPVHTALADYFHQGIGFTVASHPEPARWPHLPNLGYLTTWHRLVWQSLRDEVHASYQVAKQHRARYQHLAARARDEMRHYAGPEPAWVRLKAALDMVHGEAIGPARKSA